MASKKLPKGLGRYLLAAAILVVFGLGARWLARRPFAEDQISELNTLQDKMVDTFVDMNRFLTTLATATIGAMGALIGQRYKGRTVPRPQLRRALAGTIFAGVSLYLGYASYDRVVWMLDKGFLSVTTPAVAWTAEGQFWSFLISVLLFADFSYNDLRGGS